MRQINIYISTTVFFTDICGQYFNSCQPI